MATVYNTFAADGIYHEPVFITRIENTDGKVLYEDDPEGVRVISAQTARTITTMLERVIQSGTGTRADIDRPAAGKTGTTDDTVDAWFAGYVPQLTAAVWMGNPAGDSVEFAMGSIGQFSRIYGGTYPALIWHNFMTEALTGEPVLDFAKPDESLWPSGKTITIKGRGVSAPPQRSFDPAPPTTVPGVPAPTAPTAPPAPTTTTVPAVTTTVPTVPAGP
jgi:penicillin-binding protein 1A